MGEYNKVVEISMTPPYANCMSEQMDVRRREFRPDPSRATQRSGYFYQFYDKHHGRGGPDAAEWLPSLSRQEEFSVFDSADLNELADEQGRMYGIRPRDETGSARPGVLWESRSRSSPMLGQMRHGMGIPSGRWSDQEPENRRGEKSRPSKGGLPADGGCRDCLLFANASACIRETTCDDCQPG